MGVLPDVHFKYIHFRMKGDTEFNPQFEPFKILKRGKILYVFSRLIYIYIYSFGFPLEKS